MLGAAPWAGCLLPMPRGCAFTSSHLGPERGVGSVFGTEGLRRALGDKRLSELSRALLAPGSAGLVWGCGGSGKPGAPCHPAHLAGPRAIYFSSCSCLEHPWVSGVSWGGKAACPPPACSLLAQKESNPRVLGGSCLLEHGALGGTRAACTAARWGAGRAGQGPGLGESQGTATCPKLPGGAMQQEPHRSPGQGAAELGGS